MNVLIRFEKINAVSQTGRACDWIDVDKSSSHHLSQSEVIIPVAVEKLAFSEESRNLNDRKCLGEAEKSLV